MSDACLFCRMVAGEIPATIVHETESTVVVVVPRAHHADAASLAQADPALVGAVVAAAGAIAEQEGITQSGYRLVFNTGAGAGQTVFHVHGHLLGGRPMAWPPG